jgi:trimethylamine--corrinoid protein Co-methyltransferase
MLRNWSEFLSPAEVEEIHKASMKVLANVGVRFPDDEALGVFRKHGVKTDGQMVYLGEDQVMTAVSTVPARFTIHARNPERSVTVGGGEPVFAPGYGAPFLIDTEVGKRAPTVEDYRNIVRLAHALPNQDMIGYLMVGPADVPPGKAYLHMLHANMVHSDKPFIGSSEGRDGALHTLEMASILLGEEVRERPVTLGTISSLTPLGYSSEMLHALIEYARHGQPVLVAAAAMAGTTAPITLAGLLVVQTAELLAGIALAQMINPGTPVIFGTASTNSDMRTGALAIGSPELALLHIGHMQIARYYGLPSRAGGALTDSHIPDARAGFESMHGLLASILGGADFVLHAAGILSSFLAFSYEKLVIDDEMCGMVRRFRRGFATTEETLAYDVITRVGPGRNYLMEPHTLERCRTEFWQPTRGARVGLGDWLEAGRPDELARAKARWQELLREHQDPPLDAVVARQLESFLHEGEE